jgi:hypothetical protein
MGCPTKGHRDTFHSPVISLTAPSSALVAAVILPKRVTEDATAQTPATALVTSMGRNLQVRESTVVSNLTKCEEDYDIYIAFNIFSTVLRNVAN